VADDQLQVRRAGIEDVPAIVALAAAALGWPLDEPNEDLFRWKHFGNPAGPSPMWVAEEQGQLVGVRVLLRWRFVLEGKAISAVRAVDTATDPAHQGRGIFRLLTMQAVDELCAEGVDFVFNTPNAQSRPGYLRMGWLEVGRISIAARPCGVGGLLRMRSARASAAKWSEPFDGGVRLGDLDEDVLADVLEAVPAAGGLVTALDPEHLRWRYGFEPLHYRALCLGSDPREGLLIARVRRRGNAREATVCEILAPSSRARRALLALLARRSGADYVVAANGALADGLVPIPRAGPVLTWRPLARPCAPRMADWHLSLGDVELL
jgi:hypothetical protein